MEMQWNPSEEEILTVVEMDNSVYIWSAVSGCLLRVLSSKHGNPITCARWNPTGEYIVTGSIDNSNIIWESANCKLLQRNYVHKESVVYVEWANRSIYATCSYDKEIMIWKIGIRIPIQTFLGHLEAITLLSWNYIFVESDDKTGLLASASDDGTIRIWNINDRSCTQNLSVQINCPFIWMEWSRSIHFTQTNLLATFNEKYILAVFNGITGGCLQRFNLNTPCFAMCFSVDALFILCGTQDGRILVVDSMSCTERKQPIFERSLIQSDEEEEDKEEISSISWCQNGRDVAVGTKSGRLFLFEFND